ncbi:MAG: VanZ family protein [Oscillospiraceae bacterium]|nr:VanZ family protein [Oscillospiraceae bacterium]
MTGKERRRNTALTILIFLTLAFIWGNSLMSRDESDGLSRWILQHIFRGVFIVDDIDSGNHILRKCAHFTEFAFLGLLLCVRFRGKRRFWLFGNLAFAAAAADETIQLFSGRGSRAADVLLDCSGAVFGIIVASVLLSLVRKRKRLRNGGLGRRPSVE